MAGCWQPLVAEHLSSKRAVRTRLLDVDRATALQLEVELLKSPATHLRACNNAAATAARN